MQKYNKINTLPSNRFKRLTGVSKSVFHTMLTVIRAAEQKRMEKGGKPSYLTTEDKLLMALEY